MDSCSRNIEKREGMIFLQEVTIEWVDLRRVGRYHGPAFHFSRVKIMAGQWT